MEKKFVFRLDSLLKYRRNRRDLCRQYLAQVLAGEQQLLEQKSALLEKRAVQLGELRHFSAAGTVEIDRAASRRYFAGQLGADVASVDKNRELIAEQIVMCRQLVAESDRDVKVVEKLREKRKQEFQYEQHRRTGLELEDTWLASNATGVD